MTTIIEPTADRASKHVRQQPACRCGNCEKCNERRAHLRQRRREHRKRWCERNPAACREARRRSRERWRQRNPEAESARNKVYRDNNRDKVQAKAKRYRNRKGHAQWCAVWAQLNVLLTVNDSKG